MTPCAKTGILLPALLWALAGCAATTPAYVQPAQPARAGGEQVDQRLGAIEGRMNEMNQRLDKVDGQVAGAQRRADEAAKQAEGVNSRLTRLWTNRFNQKVSDSLEVYFSPDSIELSDAAQTALLSVVKEMQAHPTLTVELGGYTDPKGALDYNYALSQRRVDAVRRFLVDKDIPMARIQAASLGPISDASIPDIKKRRVTIRLMADQE
jgi:outer membrane protein OmpA-like peptidoglycan-associated protein